VLWANCSSGYCWFIDDTPWEDGEFTVELLGNERSAQPGSEAGVSIDLLTAVMHELGHVVGLSDTDDHSIMHGTLGPGIRRTLDETWVNTSGLNEPEGFYAFKGPPPTEDDDAIDLNEGAAVWCVKSASVSEPVISDVTVRGELGFASSSTAASALKSAGDEYTVNTTSDDYQDQASSVVRADGTFVVVWSSYSDGGGIYGKLFNSDGTVSAA